MNRKEKKRREEKNVFYVGQMSCNGILYQGKHPAMVTRALFDRVQEEFKKTNKSKVTKNFDFLYPGIAKCGLCGYAISGERKRKTKKSYLTRRLRKLELDDLYENTGNMNAVINAFNQRKR